MILTSHPDDTMHRGYVKLWRKSIDGGWLKDHKLWSFWCWCLVKATYKPIKILVGRQEVSLEPGQFVFGRKVASEELDIHESAIYRIMQFLTKAGNISIKSNNKFSIISINNWHTYQQDEFEFEQQANNKRTTSEHKQEVKKEKNNTYSTDFLSFYSAYPRKVDKFGAWRAWEKFNGDRPEISRLLVLIEKLKNTDDWKKENGKYIPHPTTWINKKRWDDEVDIGKHTDGKPIITG